MSYIESGGIMSGEVNKISLKAFTYLFCNSEKSNRRFCFILGSGASREAGILTGVEMSRIWSNELEKKYDKKELSELMKKLKIEDIEPNSKNYFGIYELLFHPDYRDGHAFLERELEKGNPSLGHYALAKILAGKLHNLVITTNFDSLVEDALFIYTDKRPLVVGHESLTGFINLNINRPIIAKIHRGLYFRPLSRQKELAGLAKSWQDTLKNAFKIYTPIVIGYAGGDQSLMKFLKNKDIEMNGLFWCYWSREEPSDEIISLVKSKNGCLVPIEGFDQMMFMLSRELAFENPEDDMRNATETRIERYNRQYDQFEKKIRLDAERESPSDERYNETLKTIDDFNDMLLKKADNEKTANSYFNRGRIFSRMFKYEEAISEYTEAISLDENYSLAYFNRGFAYNELMEYEKAISDYSQTIKLEPNDPSAYNNRGFAYIKLHKYTEALVDLNIAIELDSEDSSFYNNRGYAYNELGEYEKSLSDYNRAIELGPDDSVNYNNRGAVYLVLEDYEKALSDFNMAVGLAPDNSSAYNNRGRVYIETGEYEKGFADLQRASDLNPDFANPYLHMGTAYYRLDDLKKALELTNKALRIDKNYKNAYLLRSKIYKALGKPNEACKDEKTASELK